MESISEEETATHKRWAVLKINCPLVASTLHFDRLCFATDGKNTEYRKLAASFSRGTGRNVALLINTSSETIFNVKHAVRLTYLFKDVVVVQTRI